MGFWGAVEETVVDGAAGAVGMIPAGIGEIGGAAIHGADALVHGAVGGIADLTGHEEFAHEQYGTGLRETLSAGAAAIPGVGRAAAFLDLGQAAVNLGVAGVNAYEGISSGFSKDGDVRTTGERINQSGREGSIMSRLSGHSASDTNPVNSGWGGW